MDVLAVSFELGNPKPTALLISYNALWKSKWKISLVRGTSQQRSPFQ